MSCPLCSALFQLLDSNEELQELLKEEGFVAVKQIVENHPVVSPPPPPTHWRSASVWDIVPPVV